MLLTAEHTGGRLPSGRLHNPHQPSRGLPLKRAHSTAGRCLNKNNGPPRHVKQAREHTLPCRRRTFRSRACLPMAHCAICAAPTRVNSPAAAVWVATVKHTQPRISAVGLGGDAAWQGEQVGHACDDVCQVVGSRCSSRSLLHAQHTRWCDGCTPWHMRPAHHRQPHAWQCRWQVMQWERVHHRDSHTQFLVHTVRQINPPV